MSKAGEMLVRAADFSLSSDFFCLVGLAQLYAVPPHANLKRFGRLSIKQNKNKYERMK
jgi:hypothetical protein